MAVNDSIVCDVGTFVHSKDIKTPFSKLNRLLEQIHWNVIIQMYTWFYLKKDIIILVY